MVDGRDGPRYQIANVAEGAVVLQGEGLRFNKITLQLPNIADAAAAADFLRRLDEELGERRYYGPPLRRLNPLVLVNRRADWSCFKPT